MALQRALILTTRTNGDIQAMLDYPHQVDTTVPPSPLEPFGGYGWSLDEGSTARYVRRLRNHHGLITQEGIRNYDGPDGTSPGPAPFPDLVLARIKADDTVVAQIQSDYQAAGDKEGTTLPIWRADLDVDGNMTRYEVPGEAPQFHPDGWYLMAETTAISDWLNAHSVLNAQFVAWLNEQLGVSYTVAEVRAWMTSHPRISFTNHLARAWRA